MLGVFLAYLVTARLVTAFWTQTAQPFARTRNCMKHIRVMR
jgi:hypothetical protein